MKKKRYKTGKFKIEFDREDNFIIVPTDKPEFFDNYSAAYSTILDLIEENQRKIALIEKEFLGKTHAKADVDRSVEISREDVRFSEEAIEVMDGIFGEGTLRKYFADVYAELPDFTPGKESFLGFLGQMTPAMETIYRRSISRQEKDRAKRVKNAF